MSLDLLPLAVADGFSYAGLLFLVALGLTLVFGVMGILNVAHGALYAFGGYAAASLVQFILGRGDPPSILLIVALFAAALAVGAVLGSLLEIGLLRRVQDKDPVLQLLITFGAFLILDDVQLLIWGGSPYSASEVSGRLGTIELMGVITRRINCFLSPSSPSARTVCCSIFCGTRGPDVRLLRSRIMPRWQPRSAFTPSASASSPLWLVPSWALWVVRCRLPRHHSCRELAPT